MSKKIVVVNGGPRRGWNTDTLLTEAAKGAESVGAEIIRLIYLGWKNTLDVFPALAVNGKNSRGIVFVVMG